MKRLNNYNSYKEYLFHQAEKTTDLNRRKKWLGNEWPIKLDGFKTLFESKGDILDDCKDALCIGARTGQEVVALKELGYNAIGIDIIPCEPHVVQCDMHKLFFEDSSFDFVFSNVFDHSLYPEKKCSEIERVLRPNGIVMMHFQVNVSQDKYTEVIIENIDTDVVSLFQQCQVVSSGFIKQNFAAMNYELVLRKN